MRGKPGRAIAWPPYSVRLMSLVRLLFVAVKHAQAMVVIYIQYYLNES